MKKAFTDQDIANLFFEGLGRTTSIIVADSDDRIIYINDWYANLLKIPKDQIIGKPIKKIIPNTNVPEVRKKGKAEIRLYTMLNGEKVVSSYIPLIIGKEIVGILSYNAVNTIDHMNTVATTDMVLRLNAELNQFKNEVVKLRSAKYSLNSIVGSSAKVTEIKELVQKVARTKSTVLIMGETGTGKELFAHAIHQESPRNKQSFIALNCAALPKDLIEAELFGYEHGAFSGARKGGNPGKFELAHMGTLYLDEIDQIPQALQSKLLRAIQEKEIERIGGTKIIKTDVRLVCTSNKDLEDLVNKGEFRKDLYYRINVLSLRIPPLRERLDDIPDLVKHFLKKINKDLGLNIQNVHPDVLKAFQRYTWPGNIRELEHLLEGSANIALSGTLNVFHFQNFMPQFLELMNRKRVDKAMNLNHLKSITEQNAIINALQMTEGNKKRASEMLQIDRSVLYKKIYKYKIDANINSKLKKM
jgi:transcriptional regulator with PAS, ATPase and Fis domain